MNEEYLQQQLMMIPEQEEYPNLFDKPEAISRYIFEVEKSPADAYNKDTARANLNPKELNSVKSNIGIIAQISYAEKLCGWNLKNDKDFLRDEQASTTVPSRSKHGFGMVLAKTDHRVQTQQLEQYAKEIDDTFNPTDPSFQEKLSKALPFLKKTEV